MNYEKASDFELSAAILESVGMSDAYLEPSSDSEATCRYYRDEMLLTTRFDINNWADIGPLIVEHEITILFDGDSVEVSYDFEGVESIHGTDETLSYHISGNKKDALRLVAICYLKMKGQER